jgi:hypothetical protein
MRTSLHKSSEAHGPSPWVVTSALGVADPGVRRHACLKSLPAHKPGSGALAVWP